MNKEYEIVILESPYAALTQEGIEINVRYARAAARDCITNYGEAPYISHLLYTQPGILRDEVPEERRVGMAAGHAFIPASKRSVVYQDLGISKGMQAGIDIATSLGKEIVYRNLSVCLTCLHSFSCHENLYETCNACDEGRTIDLYCPGWIGY